MRMGLPSSNSVLSQVSDDNLDKVVSFLHSADLNNNQRGLLTYFRICARAT